MQFGKVGWVGWMISFQWGWEAHNGKRQFFARGSGDQTAEGGLDRAM